ncbi:unnamed protein product, partial [Closterium sp. NIES-53]
SAVAPLLVSLPVTQDCSLAPPPWSPVSAAPLWHALQVPCLWSSQGSPSPTTLACSSLSSLCRGAVARRSSLFLVPSHSGSPADSPHGRGEVPDVLIPWIRAARLQLRERFQSDFPVLRLHSNRGGEFSSDLLAAYCAEHGIRQTFTLPASP